MKEKRTETVIFKVTVSEKKVLEKKAEQEHLSLSSYVRKTLFAERKEK